MIKSITFHTRPLRSKVIFEIFPIISTYLLQSQQPFMDSSKKLFKDLLRKHLQLQSSYGNNNICPKIPFSFTKVRGKIIFCCKKKKCKNNYENKDQKENVTLLVQCKCRGAVTRIGIMGFSHPVRCQPCRNTHIFQHANPLCHSFGRSQIKDIKSKENRGQLSLSQNQVQFDP